ncbi:MAG TPA: hypothetical protein VFB39_14305 [Solirubrobacteraceae bacterium]|nr:hypothetical protein [Solirubrobacteraceae bacterium]
MLSDTIEKQNSPVNTDAQLRRQVERLRSENERLRSENKRLRAENRQLHATLATYVNRARSTAVYGPVEMTAGTNVGPRRHS